MAKQGEGGLVRLLWCPFCFSPFVKMWRLQEDNGAILLQGTSRISSEVPQIHLREGQEVMTFGFEDGKIESLVVNEITRSGQKCRA